jgi:hypothetical protein
LEKGNGVVSKNSTFVWQRREAMEKLRINDEFDWQRAAKR